MCGCECVLCVCVWVCVSVFSVLVIVGAICVLCVCVCVVCTVVHVWKFESVCSVCTVDMCPPYSTQFPLVVPPYFMQFPLIVPPYSLLSPPSSSPPTRGGRFLKNPPLPAETLWRTLLFVPRLLLLLFLDDPFCSLPGLRAVHWSVSSSLLVAYGFICVDGGFRHRVAKCLVVP